MVHRGGRRPRRREHGQVLAVFAFGLIGLLAMVALVIEGGNLFAQQRIAQNGTDAAANAGALVVADNVSGIARTGSDVAAAINTAAGANGLQGADAEYTDGFGEPIGVAVDPAAAIPTNARGVRVGGDRTAGATVARVLGIDQFTASAEATAVAGPLSAECSAEDDGCTLLPVTFPVKVFQCDENGNLLGGEWIFAPPPEHSTEGYWAKVGAEDLPTDADPDGNPNTMAILPLCRGSGQSSGTFGWLDLVPGMNLAEEITGPLSTTIDIPNWFQTQTGNPNSVEDELEAYIHVPVLIPLHNQACREDPGGTDVCNNPGVDPNGNNTWYYVHTLAVFYIHQVLVQGNDLAACASAPGWPQVPVTQGSGFLGCLKGWFIDYRFSGPIVPGGEIVPGKTIVAIQLFK